MAGSVPSPRADTSGGPAARVHRFGVFALDADARTLLRDGAPVALPPKAFDCVVYLIANRQRAIGRDEMIAAVWGKVDVGDSVLGQTILLARKALDDSGRGQQYIRTVTRFGYQWVAPIEAVNEAPSIPPSEARDSGAPAMEEAPPIVHAAEPRPRKLLRWWLPVALLAGLAMLFALQRMRPEPPPATTDSAPVSTGAVVAVLPARVRGDADTAWMRLGLMALVGERLRARDVVVVPDESIVALSRAYERAGEDPAQLRAFAAAAGANLVIEAQAELDHGVWRVSLRTPLGGGPAQVVTGSAVDAIDAARSAADALAARMGWPVEPHAPAHPAQDDDPLLQRIQAAFLEEKLELARALIDGASPAQRASAAFRFAAARIDYESGRLDAAKAAFQSLLDDPAAATDMAARGEASNALGAIHLLHADAAGAMPLFDEAIRLLSSAHAESALGKAYGNRATAHAMQRDYDAERADLANARIALSTAGDALGLAILDSNRAASEMNRDRYAEAERMLRASVDRYAAFRAYAAELNARSNLGLVQLALLQPSAALETDRRLVELLDKVPAAAARRTANLTRARILLANGHVTAATALLDQVGREAAGDASTQARIAGLRASLAFDRGEHERAEREAQAAVEARLVPDDARERGGYWLTLVRAQLARGDVAGADASLERARRWAERETLPNAWPRITLARAERAAHGGDAAAARALFDEALAQAERADVPVDRVAVSAAYIPWLVAQADFGRASVVAEGIAGWAEQDFTAALAQLEVFHALRDPAAWRQALERTRALAGERTIPAALAVRGNAPPEDGKSAMKTGN